MQKKHAIVKVNSNFHHVAGENLLEKNDARFSEYRKKWKKWPEEFYVGEFPLFIDIEVTSACNLKCPFCATTFRGKDINKGFITFDTVKDIIDEGADNNLYGIKFNIRGEPLLHCEIHEFVKYAKKKRLLDVYFNTNAMLLTEEISKKLIDAGLDRISISFEGHTKDVYEKYRVGARYETTLVNIENLQRLKEKMNVKHPKVRIQTVMLPELEPTFSEYEAFWSSRADEIAFLDHKEMKDKKKDIKCSWVCPQVWQRMGVFWDGTILPCNHDDDALLCLGRVGETTIKKAWNSDRLKKIREIHRNGRAHEIEACNGCYLRDSEMAKFMEEEKSQ